MRRLQLLVLLILSIVACSAAVARADNGVQTTLLLSPSGQPVGGVWQQWMNDSYMPTYSGSMVLEFGDLRACDSSGASACTDSEVITPDAASGVLAYPETILSAPSISPNVAHWTLLYEQAHVLDARYLTDAQRAQFLSLWHQPPLPAGVTMTDYWLPPNYQSDPTWFYDKPIYGEWFADDYALCAMLPRWTFRMASWLHYPFATDSFLGLKDVNNLVWDWTWYRGKWLMTGRITKTDRWAVRTQQQSCTLIRSWITAATGNMAGT